MTDEELADAITDAYHDWDHDHEWLLSHTDHDDRALVMKLRDACDRYLADWHRTQEAPATPQEG